MISLALLAPQRALLPLADTVVVERPGWFQITTPSLKSGVMNEVICSRVEGDPERIVSELIAHYGDIKWRLSVHPGGEALIPALRDFEAHAVHAMMTDVRAAKPVPSVTVEAADRRTLDDFTRVMVEGWGVGAEGIHALHERILAEGERRPMLIARIGGELAGGAALALLPDVGFFLGAVVLPKFRRRGVYEALVAERLRRCALSGCRYAVTHAMADTSAPLLAKRGWRSVVQFRSFRSPGA